MNTTNRILPEYSTAQTFIYDAADQLITAFDDVNYGAVMSYGNYGKIDAYTSVIVNPSGSFTYYETNYSYNDISNSFAADYSVNSITTSDEDGYFDWDQTIPQSVEYNYGINGSIRKRATPGKTEYYYFNAFDQVKAYGSNGSYGYYNYDDAGQRMYKVQLSNIVSRTNALEGSVLEVEKLMLYPNGYININQNGEYTKHFYADAARIASKIGTGFGNPISNGAVQNDDVLATMKRELCEVTTLYDTVDNINYSFGQITHLQGDSNKVEEGLFFYHGNHLSSTQMVTDMHGSITQAVLYTPWGNVISEYRQDWMLDTIPRYLFNGKEKDEESGMYYFEARYYSDEDIVFRGRDPLFEKYFWVSPYAYCRNNPLIFIDPNGEDEYEFDKKGKLLNVITNDKADILRIVKADRSGNIKTDKNGNTKTIATSGQYKAGTITSYTKDSKSLTMDIANNESREGMFKFLAGNTKVEWGTINGCENGETGNGAEINKIGTNYENGWTNSLHPYIDDILDRGGVINEYSHSHPSGSIGTPSGYSHASWITPSYGKGCSKV